MNKTSITNLTPYLLFFALFTGIIAPSLFSDGMFTDGTMYASIARNLAEGNESFWHLHFSGFEMANFYAHPPLVFFLTSIGYKLFGDSMIVERIYSFSAAVFTGILIALITNTVAKENKKTISVTALFIWLAFPLVLWSYSNNMLENTLAVFVLLSIFFIIKSFNKNRFVMLFFAGLSIFAAFMSKGFPALFVWSVFFFYWLIFRKISFERMLTDSFLLVFFSIVPFFTMVFISKDAFNYFTVYFSEQVLSSFEGTNIAGNRFLILNGLLIELIIPVGVISLLSLISKYKKRKIKFQKQNLQNALLFFLIALSGILPLILSHKQRNFYIVQALPFLAIAFSFIIFDMMNTFSKIYDFFKRKIFKPLSVILFAISLLMIFIFAGKTGRDKDKLHDIYVISDFLPENTNVKLSKSLHSDWSLYAYAERYGKLTVSDRIEANYYLTEKKLFCDTAFQKINLDLKKYTLFQKKQ